MAQKIITNPSSPPQGGECADRDISSPGFGRLMLWCFGPSLVSVTLMLLAERPSLLALAYAPVFCFLSDGFWVVLLGSREMLLPVSGGMFALQFAFLWLIKSRKSEVGASAVVAFGLLKAAWSAYFLAYLVSYLA